MGGASASGSSHSSNPGSSSSNASRALFVISSSGSRTSVATQPEENMLLPDLNRMPIAAFNFSTSSSRVHNNAPARAPLVHGQSSGVQNELAPVLDPMIEDPSPIANAQFVNKKYTTIVRVVKTWKDAFDGPGHPLTFKCVVYDLWGYLAEVDTAYGLADYFSERLKVGLCYTLRCCHSAVSFGLVFFVDRNFYVDLRGDTAVYPQPDTTVASYSPYMFKTLLQIFAAGPLKERFLVEFVGIVVGIVHGGRPMIRETHAGDIVCIYLIDRDYCAQAAELVVDIDTAVRFGHIFLGRYCKPFVLLASVVRVHVNSGDGVVSLSSTKWSEFSVACDAMPDVEELETWKKNLPGVSILAI